MQSRLHSLISAINRDSKAGFIARIVPYNLRCTWFCRYLLEKGKIESYRVCTRNKKKVIVIMYLFYGYSNAITSIQIISRPGNRCYVTRDQIYNMCRHNREYNGAHYVLRTSLGYLSGNEAIEECIGGEVICRIF